MSGDQRAPARQRPTSGLSRRAVGLARLALFWETLWPAAWPPLGILGLFLAVALSGLLEDAPVWLHATLLALFLLALGWTLYRLAHVLAFPGIDAAERRIERDSNLSHRPLAALDDELALGAGDAFAEALWRAHLARMRAALGRIRIAWPRPGLAGRDPRALRLALILLLTLGLIYAGRDAPTRILEALSPGLGPLASRTPATVELWLTPPAYTGVAPIFLRAGGTQDQAASGAAASPVDASQGPINVPTGAKILARFVGGSGQPQLALGDRTLAFKSVDSSTYQLEDTLISGDKGTGRDKSAGVVRLAVRQGGREIAAWPIHIVPDLAPTIAFAAAPAPTLRAALRLEYMAADDYGLAHVKAVIRRVQAPKDEAPLVLDLPLAAGFPRHAHETSFHDLTPHPWAGLKVTVELQAADEPGQIGSSGTFSTVLPERVFNHPVARAIIEQRKELTKDPAARTDVADALSSIANHPELFNGDIDVFLALIAARSQLRLSGEPGSIASVQELLWDTALGLEEGHLSVAERDLRDLQRQLAAALERNAPDKEIQELISKLEDAVQRYLQELARQEMQQPDQAQAPIDPNSQLLQSQDLNRLIDRMREMAQTGARDAARQLLAQLQDMLENMRTARMAQRGQGDPKGASGLMRGMDDLIGKQDRLLQRTFREAQRDSNMPAPLPGAGTTASEQESLRRALGEIMRRMGDMAGSIPDKLGEAERAMHDAIAALDNNTPDDAVDAQTKALEALRQGREAMMQGLKKQLGESGDPTDLDAFGPSRDPTGRIMPGFGNFDSNDVEIPERSTIQRAREIQDELQRRAGERGRPEIELDYIDRLLKRF
jgi:uncharacterized protein (TIGR02302 family)